MRHPLLVLLVFSAPFLAAYAGCFGMIALGMPTNSAIALMLLVMVFLVAGLFVADEVLEHESNRWFTQTQQRDMAARSRADIASDDTRRLALTQMRPPEPTSVSGPMLTMADGDSALENGKNRDAVYDQQQATE